MMTTDKTSCVTIAELLQAHGVEDIVISPGSRNTPLTVAVRRHDGGSLRTHVVIDERSAAFFGLGIALETRRPTALICTSGSAVLNYGPAVAEAYYRHIPLIVISADRPAEWIDQDDSQTIRQAGVLDNIVKGSFDIDGENSDRKTLGRFISRTVNDAINLATRAPQGPVHINVRLDEPLGSLAEFPAERSSKIELWTDERLSLSDSQFDILASQLTGKKVMVIGGFGHGSSDLDRAIDSFADSTGAAVFYEAQSNLHLPAAVSHIDACLSVCTEEDLARLKPDLVITFGGSVVSRMIKRYLRRCEDLEHWHLGPSANSIDCLMALTRRIECDEVEFFTSLAARAAKHVSHMNYSDDWLAIAAKADARLTSFLDDCPWSDFLAAATIMRLIPREWHLQLSNGTSIRYAQLFDYSKFDSIECNRGVSGIDGSTSTAIGSHVHFDGVTLLMTGDMSAQYDVGALALNEITPRFKMAVLNNGGGGIFRFIKSTSALDELEECFAAKVNLPLKQLADAYGFAYFEADNEETLISEFSRFAGEKSRPAILNILTPPQTSAQILKQFFQPSNIK